MNLFYHLGRLIIRAASFVMCCVVIPATVLVPLLFVICTQVVPPSFGLDIVFILLLCGDIRIWYRFHCLLVASDADYSLTDLVTRVTIQLIKVALLHVLCVACVIAAPVVAKHAMDPMNILAIASAAAAVFMLAMWWVFSEQCRHDETKV